MKKEMKRPETEIIMFGSADIITSSGKTPDEEPEQKIPTAKMSLNGYFK